MSELTQLNKVNLNLLPSNVTIPKYDRKQIKSSIVHIGVGGFHRAHEASYCDKLITEHGITDWGICGIGLMKHDHKIYNILKSQDYLYSLIVKELDGSLNTRVIGSIVDFIFAPEDPYKAIEKMSSSDVKIISLTITEGGYNLNESTGEFDFENPTIKDELNNPNEPITVFGYLTQALKVRKEKNNGGCTLQSCDNIRGNGHILKKMLCSFISKIDVNLLDWVKKNVSFPNSMVDRITPATVDSDRELLEKIYGLKDDWPVVCEPFIQWVIEDDFIGGRPAWEKVGVQFVSDVVPYENMKLRLLNAGHMVVGILGALHGYDKIDEASSDEDFSVFLRSFMDIESTPMLAKLEGIDLDDYKDTLLSRFKNKNIKDHISRICLQSSAKMPKFVLPTLRAQLESTGIIQRGAFLIAAWCKYCNGVNDNGQTYEIEDDIPEILKEAAKQSLNDPLAFLRIESVFGELSKNEKFIESFTDSFAKIKGRKIKECVKEMNLL